MDPFAKHVIEALSHDLNVEVRRGREDDVRLPYESVDIIVMSGVHLGAGLKKLKYSRITLPWLRSMARALRSGGIMIIEDNNMEMLQQQMVKKVEKAGLENLSLRQGRQHGLSTDQWIAVFKRP